jgi:spore cortex formation protein SpoVR/YcgB (stage V sporulation)
MSNNGTSTPTLSVSLLEIAELHDLVKASQTNGAGLDKKIAAHTLDLHVTALWTEGVTLKALGEVLGVKESSIHTRVVRIRNLELAD